jgi:hypothetical protein
MCRISVFNQSGISVLTKVEDVDGEFKYFSHKRIMTELSIKFFTNLRNLRHEAKIYFSGFSVIVVVKEIEESFRSCIDGY